MALASLHNNEECWVLVRKIVDRTTIPQSYLHKILHALGKSGIIQSKRGNHGGMALPKPASETTVFDVVEAVEGRKLMNRCLLGLTVTIP